MGVMRDLNQYLKRRGQRWYYVRRVPRDYADFDRRGLISQALKTQSLEVARVRRDALAEADEQFWQSIAATSSGLQRSHAATVQTRKAMRAYKAARHRAMAKGFIYTPIHDLAAVDDVADIIERLKSIPENCGPAKEEADAVLGTVPPPEIKISQALEIYCAEIAISEQIGKSESQCRSWKKVKLRAVNNFIRIVGDIPMDKINRDHARKFYNWWAGRLRPKDGSKPLTGGGCAGGSGAK